MNENAQHPNDSRMNPFPGLRPFEFNEAQLFFGREGQSQELIRRLARNKFLTVIGTSGSGKSSLVRAGLLPSLTSGFDTTDNWSWHVAVFRPGENPIESLAKALRTPGVLRNEKESPANEADELIHLAMMETNLRRGSLGLIEAIRDARFQGNEKLLLVVDQFEELFTYQEESKDERRKADAAAFVKLLLEAAKDDSIYVVLTMRSDYLGECAQFRDLPEALNDGQYLIPRMTRQQRRLAIEGPVAKGNGEIAPRLVQRLLNDVGEDPDQLPILQHALMRTWDEWMKRADDMPMDLPHYEAIGTLSHALDQHANEAFDRLPVGRMQKIAEKMFKCLTKKDAENRAVRRPASVTTIAAVANVKPKEIIDIIEKFQGEDRNFITTPGSTELGERSLIDISHESLIRNWSSLAGGEYKGKRWGWVEEESESKAMFLRLVDAAKRFEEKEGNLWRDPELALAVQWQELQQPNAAWAELYGGKFEEAQSFLDKSLKARQGEKRVRYAQMGLVGLLVLAIIGALLWGLKVQRQSVKDIEAKNVKIKATLHEAEESRKDAEEAQAEAEALARVAQIAKDKVIDANTALAQANKDQERLTKKAEEERNRAKRQKKKAERQAQLVKTGAILSAAFVQLNKDPTLGALLLASLKGQTIPSAGWTFALKLIRSPLSKTIMRGHEGGLNFTEISQNGKFIVTASKDGTARIWRTDGKEIPIVLSGHKGWVLHATFSPVDQRVATASEDGTARIWRADGSGEHLILKGHSDWVKHVDFSPDGELVVTASNDGTARVWRTDGKNNLITLRGHDGGVNFASFSKDGKKIVTTSGDGTARVWEADGSGEVVVLRGHKEVVRHAAFSPDGSLVVTSSEDKTAMVWNVNGGPPRKVLKGHGGSVNHAAFAPGGRRVVTASEDGTARIWLRDGVGEPKVLGGHTAGVHSVAFSRSESHVVTASKDGTARVWRVDGSGKPVVLRGHDGEVRVAAIINEYPFLEVLTASEDHTARVWSIGEKIPYTSLYRPDLLYQRFATFSFSQNGRKILAVSDRVEVWQADDKGPPVNLMDTREEKVTHVAFSPDGTQVAAGFWDGKMRVLQADGTGIPVMLHGHEGRVTHIAFSPDGTQVVAGAADGTARVWRADGTGTPTILRGHEGRINNAAFSPDGTRLVTGSEDGTARVWQADGTGTPVKLLGDLNEWGWREGVLAVFSPDGMQVATGSEDGTTRVWKADGTGIPLVLQRYNGETADKWGVAHISFSPDGTRVLVVSTDDVARVSLTDGTRDPVLLGGQQHRVAHATFVNDGKQVMTASRDGSVMVWHADVAGEPTVLLPPEAEPTQIVFSPDGEKVLRLIEKRYWEDSGGATVWRVGWTDLQNSLRNSVTTCLTVDQRLFYLAETPENAEANWKECERQNGRLPLDSKPS